jgi:hypothetical protein
MAFDPSTASEFNPVGAKPVATGETGFDPSSAKAFDPTSAKAAKEDKGFFSELKKGLGEMSFEDWKKNSMIAPILEYTARSALGGIMPGLEPVTPAEQKQVARSASETFNALKQGVANPIETGKAIVNKARENPGAFTADLIKGLVYDPEMLATGAVGRIGKLTEEAGTAAKVGRVAVNTANTATQFGVLAAGAEGAKAKLEGRDVNPEDLMKAASESVYTAVAFEALHNALEGTGRAMRRPQGEVTVQAAPPMPLQPKGPAETLFRTPEEKNLVTGKADAIRDEIESIQAKYAGTDKPLTKTDAARLKTLDSQMAKDPRLVEAMKQRIEQKKAFTEAEPAIVTEEAKVPVEPPVTPETPKADRYATQWADVAGLYAKRSRNELLSADEIRKIKDFERMEAGEKRPGEVPPAEPATKTERAFYEIYPGQTRESVLATAKEDKLSMLDETAPPADKTIVDKSLSEIEQMKREGSYAQQAEESVRQRLSNMQAKERFIHNDTVKVVKDVPDPVARERIAEAIDTGNLKVLTAKELETANFLKQKFRDIGERAQKLGIVKELRDNYITHIVDWEKSGIKNVQDAVTAFIETGAAGREGMSGKSRFGKERKYETFEDLNKALVDSGLELRTKDAAEIYQQYARSMERAIENKELINNLKSLTDVEGYPLMQRITEKEPIPRGWTTINAPQMQGYAVHPEVAPALKFIFENSDPSKVMKGLNAISQITKRLQVMGSLFHAKSLLEAKLFTGFVPFAQDILTGFKGTRDAIDMFKKGGVGDEVDFLIKNGLKVEMPEDVSRGILSDIGRAGDSLMEKVGPIKGKNLEKIGAGVEKYTLGLADKVTWDFMHTGFKLQVAMRELEKMKRNYPEANPAELAKEVSSFVNNSFGGLNWFDVAQRANTKIGKELAMWAFNNQNRRALQLVLFAPDWTVSTLRALSTSFGKGTGIKGLVKPRTEADLARMYQLRAALVYGTILNGLNNMTAGRDIWDNKDPTRLEFRDGTSMQLAKHSMEPVHWLKDPAKTLTNKLGFLPQITAPLIFGKEYLQPGAPELLDPSMSGRLKAAGQKALPFQIQSVAGAPEGEGIKRAVAGTLGFPVYGGTPEQKAKQRVERKKAEMEKRIKYIKEEQERAKKTRPE